MVSATAGVVPRPLALAHWLATDAAQAEFIHPVAALAGQAWLIPPIESGLLAFPAGCPLAHFRQLRANAGAGLWSP